MSFNSPFSEGAAWSPPTSPTSQAKTEVGMSGWEAHTWQCDYSTGPFGAISDLKC